jgi:hypothetical protein
VGSSPTPPIPQSRRSRPPRARNYSKKIQANIAAGLASELPGLKLPLENQELKFAFHIERNPGGGFAIHSADPNAQPIEAATHDEIESHFAEKLIAFVGRHLVPELSQALAGQGNSGDIKVFVNRKTGFTLNASSHTLRLGIARDLPFASSIQPDDAKMIEDAKLGCAKTTNTNFGSVGDTIGNSPNHSRDQQQLDHLPVPVGIAHHRRDDVFLRPLPLTHSKFIISPQVTSELAIRSSHCARRYKSVDLIRSAWKRFVLIMQPLQFHYSEALCAEDQWLGKGFEEWAEEECLSASPVTTGGAVFFNCSSSA